MTDWMPDVLGTGFEQLTLNLPGAAVATLVRHVGGPLAENPALPAADVLYLHGWSDYFFQSELAEFWHSTGARFYALDLRNYGRSLRDGLVPGQVTSLTEYDDDIAAALSAMGRGGAGSPGPTNRPLILVGHSTGGLTASLWAARHPGEAAAVVLNSPWLEFQATQVGRAVVAPLIQTRSRFKPLAPLPPVDPGFYTRAVSSRYDGEWEYEAAWRPDRGFPVTAAFLNAVFHGQAQVARGLGIDVPVLVMLSDKSYLQPRWSTGALAADVVLNVDTVARRSPDLGLDVTLHRIPGAFHDVFLSPATIRNRAYAGLGHWVQAALDPEPARRWDQWAQERPGASAQHSH